MVSAAGRAIGPVDAYLVTHHGQSMTDNFGDYYYGLSCCSAAEVSGLNPRAPILSMGAQGHELITGGGEKGVNTQEQFIANTGGTTERSAHK